MLRSRVGWLMTRFPNNNRARERPVLIHTCLFSANGGKLAAILSLSYIGNWWPVATLNRMSRCMSSLFACSQKGRRTQQKDATSLQLLFPLGRRLSSSFVGLCELEMDEQETLITLRQLHPEIDLAYDLVQQFAQMLRTRTGEQLDDWLEKVRASQIREFQGFVAGIERDKAAVVAGLTLPQNNGLVEGKVNKLKLIKRMMYGRARFALLRQRVLHAL
jgi:transposase